MPGNVVLMTVTTCSLPRSLRFYAHLMQTADNDFVMSLKSTLPYHSGQLHDPIAPRCYGAFKGNHVDVLILDLCEGVLKEWVELSISEQ